MSHPLDQNDFSAIVPSAIATFVAVLLAQWGAWSPAALAIAMVVAFVGLAVSVGVRARLLRLPSPPTRSPGRAAFDRPPIEGEARRVDETVQPLQAAGQSH